MKLGVGKRCFFSHLISKCLTDCSLDPETTEKMCDIIRTELSGCTVVAIAHQICAHQSVFICDKIVLTHLLPTATIMDFDQVIVMEDGTIIESGSPRELLSLPKSRFASLAADQGIL